MKEDPMLFAGRVACDHGPLDTSSTKENTMFAAIRYGLAQARLADLYCQAVRDAAMLPAIHYDLTRARIADVHHQAQRHAGHRPRR